MISWVPLGSSPSATYEGTRDVILKETERQVNNVNNHNVAASIAARSLNQDRYRCSSTTHDLPMLLSRDLLQAPDII